MTNFLGYLYCRSVDATDVIIRIPLFENNLTAEELHTLIDSEELKRGYDDDGQILAATLRQVNPEFTPVDLKGVQEVEIAFEDGGESEFAYDVEVMLMLEEPNELINE